MSESPGSPVARRLAAPGWLDGRLVLGVLLVLLSVILGARVLSNADRSQLVWASTGDLAVGSQLSESDLTPVRVRLFDSVDRYLDATRPPPVGYTVRRGIGAGELLPDDALGLPEEEAFRLVTVPLEVGHFRLPGAGRELAYDTAAPRRNGATLAVLQAADTVYAVGSADPVGLQRLVRGLAELADVVPAVQPRVIVNRLRGSGVPGDAEKEIRAALLRYAGVREVLFVPLDVAAVDAALAAGRTLAEAAPASPARVAVAALAASILGLARQSPPRRRFLAHR